MCKLAVVDTILPRATAPAPLGGASAATLGRRAEIGAASFAQHVTSLGLLGNDASLPAGGGGRGGGDSDANPILGAFQHFASSGLHRKRISSYADPL